ncbi:nucleotidyltransferase domain-containing protein [Patescibacteria group bacterium]|nr:nucleotidyltransferase domain-containing protein [Patescibacteria group bacterium]
MKKKKYIDWAKKYAKIVVDSGIRIKMMYIFGSRARGGGYKYSDLDISVVSPDFGKDRLSERVRLMGLTRKVSLLIEPHPFSVEDFSDKCNLLAEEIKRTGIRVI